MRITSVVSYSSIASLLISWGASAADASKSTSDSKAVTNTTKISAEDFGALPFMTNPKLSPDGSKVLASVTVGGREAVIVVDLKQSSKLTDKIPIPDEHDLVWYRWAGNGRILISLAQSIRYFGEDARSTRLLMYDLSTAKPSFVGKTSEGLDGDDVVHVDRDGRYLLLSIQRTIYDYPSVWRVDLDTMKMKEIVKPQLNVWNWFADSNGVVRAGLGSEGKRWWLLYRKDEAAKFEKVVKRKIGKDDEDTDIERFIPIDGSDAGYAVANKKTGRYGLYRYDFANDSLGDPIFEHPQVDIDDFYQSDRGEIEAVYYTDDRSRIEWLNPKMKEIQNDIDAALPNRINRVISIDRGGTRMIVWTGGPSEPGLYYVYQIEAGKMFLFSRPYEKISGKRLATVESTRYQARDGLEIPAYVTLPNQPVKALPLIVMPHGGPFARDRWEYDVWAQFLANRGYVVLQPNFRGSTGYGKSFVERGMGQMGRGMQDDLDDGVKWLVDQGKVDPKRVCIMGASYGGYAAMWAAARNPEIYRCAVSLAGISDVRAMLRYDRRMFSASRYFRIWQQRVQGDKDFDLDTVSPLRTIDKIAIPILIAHGGKDVTVPISQSKRLHEALLKANKPHEFVAYPEAQHGFTKAEDAIDFLKRVDVFLAKYNPTDQ